MGTNRVQKDASMLITESILALMRELKQGPGKASD
jgi:hypothetical protein